MENEVKAALETLQKATATCAAGDDHIVVLDRGWVFVGKLSREGNACTLSDAWNCRNWKGGFGALTKSKSDSQGTFDKCAAPIKFDARAMIFAVPVSGGWYE